MTLNAADRIEIHELVSSYGVHHDRRDFGALASCFVPDASYVMRIADGTVHGPHAGVPAIIDQIRAFKAAQDDVRRHHITNVQVTATGPDAADVVSYVLVSVVKHGQLTVKTVGTYADRVVRTADGWRIAAKELLLDSAF